MQVIAEAINALTALMLTITEASDDAGSARTKSSFQKHGRKLQEALHTARYHQIKQCRAAAIEAGAVLQAMLPSETLQPAKPSQQAAASRPAEAQRRKGPWLHEKTAAAPRGAATPRAARNADGPTKAHPPAVPRPNQSWKAAVNPDRCASASRRAHFHVLPAIDLTLHLKCSSSQRVLQH